MYEHDSTPPSSRDSNLDPPDYITHPEESDYGASSEQYPRKSVYDSRIEQILYENPEMPILITDAGKNHEGGGSFIVYTIRTAVCMPRVRRRCPELTELNVGPRGSSPLLGVRIATPDPGQPTSNLDSSTDPRKA